jgi:hypothetical protein
VQQSVLDAHPNAKIQLAIVWSDRYPGSAILNKDFEIVGIGVGSPDKTQSNDPDYDPTLAYASHIFPVLDILVIRAITSNPDNPEFEVKPTLSDSLGSIEDERNSRQYELHRKLLATEDGRRINALFTEHRDEIVDLVNHCRRVTICWHRNNGPAFFNRFLHNVRDPERSIPKEIGGVTLETLIRHMARAFSEHGSDALKDFSERHLDEALAYAARLDNIHELVEELSTGRSV